MEVFLERVDGNGEWIKEEAGVPREEGTVRMGPSYQFELFEINRIGPE